MNIKLCVVILSYSSLSYCQLWPANRRAIMSIEGDLGEPLILTSLLKENKIEEAQNAALVNNSIFGDVKSYSGYFKVDEVYDSNLFFWFFPAFEDSENAPVVLWLEGGPGASSMFGLFQQNGPFVLESASEVGFREIMWATAYNLLYIDSPAGTGFSFTNGGYANNQTKVGEDLYSAVQQFFTMFPELRQNEFFATGESYAGKYVPALGYQILKRNSAVDPELLINLKGLFIGNGLSDPERQLMYGDNLYQIGLIDSNERDEFKEREDLLVKYIQEDNYTAASFVVDSIDSLFIATTGFFNYYNLLIENDINGAIQDNYMYEFLNTEDIRKSIHVGNITFDDSYVYSALKFDIPKSITSWVSELLSNYRVCIYNGQLDLRVPYTQTTEYLRNLDFDGAEEYKQAPRYKWYVGDDLAGYVKVAGNLTEALVRNAGHMVPIQEPEWALDLLTRFIRNEKIYSDE